MLQLIVVLCVVPAILMLFLVNGLKYNDDNSTIIFHTFVVLSYFSPLLGAMVSDGWLGKFRLSFSLCISIKQCL